MAALPRVLGPEFSDAFSVLISRNFVDYDRLRQRKDKIESEMMPVGFRALGTNTHTENRHTDGVAGNGATVEQWGPVPGWPEET